MSVFYPWMIVCLCMMSFVSTSWIRRVDCSNLTHTRGGPGYGASIKSFKCNIDGSVECSTTEEFYSCYNNCTKQEGFRRYESSEEISGESSGEVSNSLGGWDCRHKCRNSEGGKLREGGHYYTTRPENCNHYITNKVYQLDSEGDVTCSTDSDCPPPLKDGPDIYCQSIGKYEEKSNDLCGGNWIDGSASELCELGLGCDSLKIEYHGNIEIKTICTAGSVATVPYRTYGGGGSGSSSRERPSRDGGCRSSHCLAGRWCCPKKDIFGREICVYC